MSNTIAAIATPYGMGGLGIIRISGQQAMEISSKVFRGNKNINEMQGYTASFGYVFDDTGDIDECIALVFRSPYSYTGEDVVELSCHGGQYLLNRALRAVFEAGAKPASAGEFTRRAFLNGKIDLTGAQAVMDLISAQGNLAAKTALSSKKGAISHALEDVKNMLLGVAANMSAYVDYPYDDIPDLDYENLNITLKQSISKLQNLLDTYDTGKILRQGIDTVIIGSPNVGKSTLMNLLSGTKRSIVTSVPGTTRDIVEETIRLGEVTLKLADTAGIRDTEDEVESIGVDLTKQRMQQAQLILIVFDGSSKITKDDKQLIQLWEKSVENELTQTIAIINKTDLPQLIDTEYINKVFEHVVYTSAQDGDGLEPLKNIIHNITGIDTLGETQPVLASEIQRNLALNAKKSLDEAMQALNMGMTLDAVGVCIDDAINALLELTGERATETVVNEVFSRFCVGK